MDIVKVGERRYARNSAGETIAYIVPYFRGAHGHQYGWEHYCYDVDKGKIVPAASLPGFDTPVIFHSIKAFADYYSREE